VEQSYKISELSQLLGISVQATWKKVKCRGLPTDKHWIDGRLTTLITLDKNQLAELLPRNSVNKSVEQRFNNSNKQGDNEFNNKVEQQVYAPEYIEMLREVKELALKAGKYELLEDRSKELKDDVNHWQEEYFKMKYQNEQLINQVNELKQLVDQERKRPFWQKF
jgi:hypothetical protein